MYFHLREGLEKNLRAMELAQSVGDARAEVEARWFLAVIQFTVGDLEGAQQTKAAGLILAEKLRDRQWLAFQLCGISISFRAKGDWRTAREYIVRGLDVSPRFFQLLYRRIFLEYEAGEFVQGADYLEQRLELARSRPVESAGPLHGCTSLAVSLSARIAGVVEHFDVAEELAQGVLSSSRTVNPLYNTFARASLALMAVQRTDAAAATIQYAPLKLAQGTALLSASIAVDRLLGLLAHTMSNLHQAIDHFQDAQAFCRKAGYRPELAWTCCDYADTLRQRNAEDDWA